MKKLIASIFLLTVGFASAQTDAFKGKGDLKYQVGVNIQKEGTGIVTSLDYGLGDTFSMGAQAGYLLGIKENPLYGKPSFADRFDIKARVNANLGEVMKLPSNIDIYPGLDLGLKNFGAHLGVRYFFDKGFGLFSEINLPIAKYGVKSDYPYLNNQFAFNFGASFDL